MTLSELLTALSRYVDVSSEMQISALEFACRQGGVIKVKGLCGELGLQYKQALDLMGRLRKKGLVRREAVGLYALTEKGMEACGLISQVTSAKGFSLKGLKLLLLVGTKLRGGVKLESLERLSAMSREDALKALTGLIKLVERDGRKIVVLNEVGERTFKEVVSAFGVGPTAIRVLAAFTGSHDPSSALLRFLLLHLGVSALVVYEVFAAPTLGALTALLWITVTLVLASLLWFRK